MLVDGRCVLAVVGGTMDLILFICVDGCEGAKQGGEWRV